jgi:TorA maturation chaperone TorD
VTASLYSAQVDLAAQRAQRYWLLSRLFLEMPQDTFLMELDQALGLKCEVQPEGDLRDLLDAVQHCLATDEAEPQAAAIAFTRHLCLGKKGELLPFEAYVREGKLPGDATEQVMVLMREAGFEDVAPEAASPDHLGAELRFMAFLCLAERDAWLSQESAQAARHLQAQRQLLREHLLQWIPNFCADLAQRASQAYVVAIARLTHASVVQDERALQAICSGLEAEPALNS